MQDAYYAATRVGCVFYAVPGRRLSRARPQGDVGSVALATGLMAGRRDGSIICCHDLLDATTALAACCGFDLCHKYTL
jgi:hypothetical protein